MSKCSDCQVKLTKENAYRKTPTRFQSKCKKCFGAYCTERWKKHKIEAIEYKGGKCYDCRQQFIPAVYEFHHTDPGTKEYDWRKMRQLGKAKRKKELDKCVMLCANCHRIRHATEA